MAEWRLVAILALLALSAFFSGSETALFALRQHQMQRLRTSPARAAGAVLALLEKPRRLLATVLVGNTFVNLLLSALTTGLFVAWFGFLSGLRKMVVFVTARLSPMHKIIGNRINDACSSSLDSAAQTVVQSGRRSGAAPLNFTLGCRQWQNIIEYSGVPHGMSYRPYSTN